MSQDNTIQTPYGIFSGVSTAEYFPDGKVKEIRLYEKNMIITHIGELVPYYGEDSARRKYKASVTFHNNGMVRAVSLEEQQEVLTPIGELPAELVTFYDTGELKRIFPLDGKISGFWSEDDERQLNIPLNFEFEFASFRAMISGICFYKSGNIKSVTLFPKEHIEIKLEKSGPFSIRNGLSIYENGELQSVEPEVPTKISTPIGKITAFDVNAIGINADSNSLCFDEQGRVMSIVSSGDRIFVHRKHDGATFSFAPKALSSDTDEETKITIPLKIEFLHDEQRVIITDDTSYSFAFDDDFVIYQGSLTSCNNEDCASCKLCGNI